MPARTHSDASATRLYKSYSRYGVRLGFGIDLISNSTGLNQRSVL
jgi:hypothetical protein